MVDRILGLLQDIRPEFDFNDVEDFFDQGMLDSFDLVTLVSELDKAFGIHIDGADILPEHFCNLMAISNLLEKYGVQP